MFQLRQPIKAGDALGNDVLMRREQIVGQGFPVGEMQHRKIGGEKLQFLFHSLGALAVGGQKQGEAFRGARSLGDGQTKSGTGQVAPMLFACGGRKNR